MPSAYDAETEGKHMNCSIAVLASCVHYGGKAAAHLQLHLPNEPQPGAEEVSTRQLAQLHQKLPILQLC